MKQLYSPEYLNSLQDIIEDDIAVQAMEFQFEAPKHNWPMPYGVFLHEMLKCLDEYVGGGNIEPIQELSTTAIKGWQDSTIINQYKAFANLQLAYKFLKANNLYQAMQYYKRGITYKHSKITTDIENDILASNYKNIGKKGGNKKAENYKKPREEALKYHDKYFNNRNKKGKFIYSNDKTAREIISYFESKSVYLGYTERSLSNIIGKHRNSRDKN